MTAPWPVLLDVAFRTTVVYFVLLVLLRVTGTRQLGQMSVFDLVLLLIIANAVQNAMVGPDTSLAGGLVAAGVLVAGEGIMLVHHGKTLATHLARAGITRDELLQALREHGVGSVEDVMLAVLEPDGSVSVIRNDDMIPGNRPHHRIRSLRRNP